MVLFAAVGEDVFECSDHTQVCDFGSEFFANFTDDGIFTGFPEFDAASKRATVFLVLYRIVSFIYEDAASAMENTQSECANLLR